MDNDSRQHQISKSVTSLMHVTFDDFVEDEVRDLGAEAVKLCQQQPGFVSATQYQVKGGNEFYLLIQWENEHAFLACKQSPAWLLLMPQWSSLQEDGDIHLEIKVLETIKDDS